MSLSELQPKIPFPDKDQFLESWKPLEELAPLSDSAPTVLILADDADSSAAFGAQIVTKFLVDYPNMPLFVIPATPPNAEAEIDKTTEVMGWLSNTGNRGATPYEVTEESPIPLVYISDAKDLYAEQSLARMVKRAKFLGLIVVAFARDMDAESQIYKNLEGMFTHSLRV